jgi:hypothetical protein
VVNKDRDKESFENSGMLGLSSEKGPTPGTVPLEMPLPFFEALKPLRKKWGVPEGDTFLRMGLRRGPKFVLQGVTVGYTSCGSNDVNDPISTKRARKNNYLDIFVHYYKFLNGIFKKINSHRKTGLLTIFNAI